jgi:hypothetical protein
VSRIWKSELRLDLRIGGCQAEMRGAGWKRRLIASASAAGTGAAAISAALSALQLVDDGAALLPADARLTVADEYVCYALLDAQISTLHALDEATQQFNAALGREDLVVQVSPLPAGNGWLAAAVLETDLHAWADALADAGVRLEHLHPALVQDLARMAGHVPEDDAAIALLRDNGATLVRLEGGVPAALAWEPFDVEDRGALDRRLQTFVHNTSPGPAARMGQAGPRANPVAIYLYTNTKVLSLYGAAADEEIMAEPRRRRRRSAEEPSSFEQALASDDPARAQPHRRRPPPEARDSGRAVSHASSARTVPTLLVPVDVDAQVQRERRSATGNPGAIALAALAMRLRQALERSRARRRERRRIEAALNGDDELLHKDFSPTGSVLPDEWQDTVQTAHDDDSAAGSQHGAGTWQDEHDLDMLATLEAEQALELAFMREDEIPPSAWRGAPAAAHAAGTAAAPGPSQDRRRSPLPAALVWPPPTLDSVEVQVEAPRSLPPGSTAAVPPSPRLIGEAADAPEQLRQAAAARAYEGLDRRRSYRA